jgi:hypothetical protein
MPTTGSWSGIYRDLMRFRSHADIERARATLRRHIWQSEGMLTGGFDRFSQEDGYEAYEVDMPYWCTTSRVRLYRTQVTPSGWLLIVHGGHDNHGPDHAALVPIRQDALAAGHDVLVVSMPGQSVNVPAGPYPFLETVNGVVAAHGNLPLWNRRYANETWVNVQFGVPPESALHAFIAPVHRMINAIGGDYDRIAITGLSGGATTVIRCAALDPRIVATYAVSGSGVCPRYVYYPTAGNYGDYEDADCLWLDVANEEETLTMIASGGRRALVVLNLGDPVCFGDIDLELYAPAAVYEAEAVGGGRLRFLLDDNPTHTWSAACRARILHDLARAA